MPTAKDIVLPVLASLVRNLLQLIFGWLIARGWLGSQPEHQDALALYIVGFLVVLALSIYQKLKQWLEKRIALALPSGASSAELASAVKNNSIWAALLGALHTTVPIAKP